MMLQVDTKCLYNISEGGSAFRIGIACSDAFERARPGQFVMVGSSDGFSPLLRRPFSIHRLIREKDRIAGLELLIKVVGPATRKLSETKKGEPVHLMGPLGRGFTLYSRFKRIFLVGGGVGVAPLLFLADRLKEDGFTPEHCRVFIGGRSRSEIWCMDRFEENGFPVTPTTDDGSFGDHCLITRPVEQALIDEKPDIIYACGPEPMLKCLAGIVERNNVPCQISIETMMACGLGACLGCAVSRGKDKNKYLHACVDGPVFDAGAINI